MIWDMTEQQLSRRSTLSTAWPLVLTLCSRPAKKPMTDLGLKAQVELVTDSSACKGLSSRGCMQNGLCTMPSLVAATCHSNETTRDRDAGGQKSLSGRGDKNQHHIGNIWRLFGSCGLGMADGRANEAQDRRNGRYWSEIPLSFMLGILSRFHVSRARMLRQAQERRI